MYSAADEAALLAKLAREARQARQAQAAKQLAAAGVPPGGSSGSDDEGDGDGSDEDDGAVRPRQGRAAAERDAAAAAARALAAELLGGSSGPDEEEEEAMGDGSVDPPPRRSARLPAARAALRATAAAAAAAATAAAAAAAAAPARALVDVEDDGAGAGGAADGAAGGAAGGAAAAAEEEDWETPASRRVLNTLSKSLAERLAHPSAVARHELLRIVEWLYTACKDGVPPSAAACDDKLQEAVTRTRSVASLNSLLAARDAKITTPLSLPGTVLGEDDKATVALTALFERVADCSVSVTGKTVKLCIIGAPPPPKNSIGELELSGGRVLLLGASVWHMMAAACDTPAEKAKMGLKDILASGTPWTKRVTAAAQAAPAAAPGAPPQPPPPLLPEPLARELALLVAAELEDDKGLLTYLRMRVDANDQLVKVSDAQVARDGVPSHILDHGPLSLLTRGTRRAVFAGVWSKTPATARRQGDSAESRRRALPAQALGMALGLGADAQALLLPAGLAAHQPLLLAPEEQVLESPEVFGAQRVPLLLSRALYLAISDIGKQHKGAIAALVKAALEEAGGEDGLAAALKALSCGTSTGGDDDSPVRAAAGDYMAARKALLRAVLDAPPSWAPPPAPAAVAFVEWLLEDSGAPHGRIQQLDQACMTLLSGGPPQPDTLHKTFMHSLARLEAVNDSDAPSEVQKKSKLVREARYQSASQMWIASMKETQLPTDKELAQAAKGGNSYSENHMGAGYHTFLGGTCSALGAVMHSLNVDTGVEIGDSKYGEELKSASKFYSTIAFTTGTVNNVNRSPSQTRCSRALGMEGLIVEELEKSGLLSRAQRIRHFGMRATVSGEMHGGQALAVAKRLLAEGNLKVHAGNVIAGCMGSDVFVEGWHPEAEVGALLKCATFDELVEYCITNRILLILTDLGRRPGPMLGAKLSHAVMRKLMVVSWESVELARMARSNSVWLTPAGRAFVRLAVCEKTSCWRPTPEAELLILMLCTGHEANRGLGSALRTTELGVSDAARSAEKAVKKALVVLAAESKELAAERVALAAEGAAPAASEAPVPAEAPATDGKFAHANAVCRVTSVMLATLAAACVARGLPENAEPDAAAEDDIITCLTTAFASLPSGTAQAGVAADDDTGEDSGDADDDVGDGDDDGFDDLLKLLVDACAGDSEKLQQLTVALRRTSPAKLHRLASAAVSMGWQDRRCGALMDAALGVGAVPGVNPPLATRFALHHRGGAHTAEVFDAECQAGTQAFWMRQFVRFIGAGAVAGTPAAAAAAAAALPAMRVSGGELLRTVLIPAAQGRPAMPGQPAVQPKVVTVVTADVTRAVRSPSVLLLHIVTSLTRLHARSSESMACGSCASLPTTTSASSSAMWRRPLPPAPAWRLWPLPWARAWLLLALGPA